MTRAAGLEIVRHFHAAPPRARADVAAWLQPAIPLAFRLLDRPHVRNLARMTSAARDPRAALLLDG